MSPGDIAMLFNFQIQNNDPRTFTCCDQNLFPQKHTQQEQTCKTRIKFGEAVSWSVYCTLTADPPQHNTSFLCITPLHVTPLCGPAFCDSSGQSPCDPSKQQHTPLYIQNTLFCTLYTLYILIPLHKHPQSQHPIMQQFWSQHYHSYPPPLPFCQRRNCITKTITMQNNS